MFPNTPFDCLDTRQHSEQSLNLQDYGLVPSSSQGGPDGRRALAESSLHTTNLEWSHGVTPQGFGSTQLAPPLDSPRWLLSTSTPLAMYEDRTVGPSQNICPDSHPYDGFAPIGQFFSQQLQFPGPMIHPSGAVLDSSSMAHFRSEPQTPNGVQAPNLHHRPRLPLYVPYTASVQQTLNGSSSSLSGATTLALDPSMLQPNYLLFGDSIPVSPTPSVTSSFAEPSASGAPSEGSSNGSQGLRRASTLRSRGIPAPGAMPIDFRMESGTSGILARDAFDGRYTGLVGRDQKPTLGECGTSISLVFDLPGRKRFSRQIKTHNWRKPPHRQTVPKDRLVREIARVLKKYAEETDLEQGSPNIGLDDILIHGMRPISRASWEVDLLLIPQVQ